VVKASSKSSAAELAALAELGAAPERLETEAGEHALRKALAVGDPRTVAQAASLIGKHTLNRCAQPLCEAYRRFADDRAHLDAGCFAKEAIVAALDALDHSDAELFAEAAVYVQRERMKGGTRDTGARLRARGILGLARIGHSDFMPIVGTCLGDREPTLRLAAAQAIAHRGQRDGAGLLLLRLQAGEDVPEIAIECLRGSFAIAPEHALRYAQGALHAGDEAQREQTLQALGTANDDRAIALLESELERLTLAGERQQVIESLGLSRRPRARELLLSIVREGRASDAEHALSALAIHRYDARLLEQLERATAHSPELTRRYRELARS
jgi:hypothetical protein